MRAMRASTRKKRELVAETALKLFHERGYEQVSVDDIIAATGTSKGTFYHYFSSKDELLAELPRRLMELVTKWGQQAFQSSSAPERKILRLFIELAALLSASPKLVTSLQALQFEHEQLKNAEQLLHERITTEIGSLLGSRLKAEFLVSVYIGAVTRWTLNTNLDLHDLLSRQFAYAWRSLSTLEAAELPDLILPEGIMEEPKMNIAIIGGGLAGLTAAAYLSELPEISGVLFERSPQLGGRAFTYEKSGFTLNYGAHAIYGLDRHTISSMEKELGLSFSSKQVDKRKVMYEKHEHLTPAPLDFVNLVKTDILNARQKVRFAAEITAIIANIHQLKNYDTLGDYLADSNADEDVKELWEHLVCSNFFIAPEDARRVPGHVISTYYHNLFLSQRPVNYILGSWAVITNQLRAKMDTSGRWETALQEGVENIRYEKGKYILKTKSRESAFDRIIFAMPAQQVVKLLKDTPWEPFMGPYEKNSATEVMVYDVGLERVVARPFSYISDMNHKMFITDVSATDHTLVPSGGQLLQGIAYLSDESFENESDRKAYLEEKTAQMEALFDRHYPGWREAIAVKRVSKKAMVQSVKNIAGNQLLPNRMESVPFYFCGDGCEGKGELAERAFSSARRVAEMIASEARTANRQLVKSR
ncbi:FAD-dependent oxidoreductase [Paenibacillus abyssi]|uniref:HTH tetR-type domain-containing protein n=1 Tax=Paenibacillus abyssi TaxID=1340531 RepID=A0A917D4U4_9BACL|nr:FAD-dependent oxidoreductase [Paenibacillus abyssi]GGG10744.1 hypothetical protein GCM10010916_29500 [Paenibacillus abyssi]